MSEKFEYRNRSSHLCWISGALMIVLFVVTRLDAISFRLPSGILIELENIPSSFRFERPESSSTGCPFHYRAYCRSQTVSMTPNKALCESALGISVYDRENHSCSACFIISGHSIAIGDEIDWKWAVSFLAVNTWGSAGASVSHLDQHCLDVAYWGN